MAISAARVTRFGIGGGIWQPAGDFSTKEEGVPVVADEAVTGGGKKRKQARKYPRWVVINGERFKVWSAEEERQLLQVMSDRAADAAKIAEAVGDEVLAKQARKKAVTIKQRIHKVDNREAEWLAQLQEEDDEILLFFER